MRVSVTHTCVFAILVAGCGSEGGERASGPLPEDAYVWQLESTGDMREALQKVGPTFREIAALAAEVRWQDGKTTVAVSDADLAGRGAVLHLQAFDGDPGAVTAEVVAAARAIAARHPIELQVAFEAQPDQLGGFTSWITAIRAAVAPLPVVVAARAAWLSSPELPGLVAAADGWVLQVHSFAPPVTAADLEPVPDSAGIAEEIEAAARLGHPFRVALPTHDYLVDLAPTGELVGVRGVGPAEPTVGRVPQVVRSEPVSIAAVLDRLAADRPAECTGVAWFRLPTRSDPTAWQGVTLAEVRAGRVPRGHVVASQVRRGAAVDVAIVNDGTDDILPPPVGFTGGVVQTLVGWRVDGAVIRPPADASPLRPGERRVIGFARTGGGFAVWTAR